MILGERLGHGVLCHLVNVVDYREDLLGEGHVTQLVGGNTFPRGLCSHGVVHVGEYQRHTIVRKTVNYVPLSAKVLAERLDPGVIAHGEQVLRCFFESVSSLRVEHLPAERVKSDGVGMLEHAHT